MCRSRAPAARNVVVASSKKTDIKKQGLESIKNPIVKQNLMGVSSSMNKKGWTDPSGRKGKVLLIIPLEEHCPVAQQGLVLLEAASERLFAVLVAIRHRSLMCQALTMLDFCPQGFGVYRFQNKYGANVDGYSPIYTPDSWAETGSQYSLGVKGLLAW